MSKISRIASSDIWRLPLALGVAGLMVTGTAAMAWPALKTALGPVPAAPVATPADPAAVSDFVATTRAQLSPALADPADIPEVTLAHAPNLMLDASILRQPRMDDQPLVELVTPAPPLPVHQEPVPEVQTAQTQTPRPLPRASAEVNQPNPAAFVVPTPVSPQSVEVQVVPVATQVQPASPDHRTRARLKNMWISGAYR